MSIQIAVKILNDPETIRIARAALSLRAAVVDAGGRLIGGKQIRAFLAAVPQDRRHEGLRAVGLTMRRSKDGTSVVLAGCLDSGKGGLQITSQAQSRAWQPNQGDVDDS